MTTYIFGLDTNPVSPAFSSYQLLTLNSSNDWQYDLFWLDQFKVLDTPNNQAYISNIIDISIATPLVPPVTEAKLFLPQANLAAVGQIVLINNTSSTTSLFIYSYGTTTAPLELQFGRSFFVYLVDNTTEAGSWRAAVVPAAGLGVINITAQHVSDNAILTKLLGPPPSNPILELTLAKDLLALSTLGANLGLATRINSAPETWVTRAITADPTTISVTNGNAIAGNPNLTLAFTTVVPGTYSLANIDVDAYGRLLTASNGIVSGIATLNGSGEAVIVTILPPNAKIFLNPVTTGAAYATNQLGTLQAHSITLLGFTIKSDAVAPIGVQVAWLAIL